MPDSMTTAEQAIAQARRAAQQARADLDALAAIAEARLAWVAAIAAISDPDLRAELIRGERATITTLLDDLRAQVARDLKDKHGGWSAAARHFRGRDGEPVSRNYLRSLGEG